MQASAARRAGAQAAASADAATNLQREIYNDTTERFKPFVAAGGNALAAVMYEMGLGPRPTATGASPAIEEVTIPGTPGTPAFVPSQNRQGRESNNWLLVDMLEGRPAIPGTPDTKRFRVGGREFETRSAAEEFAAANRTGGTEYEGYSKSPMARYLLEKGVDSIDASAASRGGLFSGATLQALENNRRAIITADTDKYFARLAGLTDMGLGAAGNQASAGANFANNAGSTMMQAGQARAQGTLGAADAWRTGITDMAGTYGFFSGSNPMAAYTAPTLMATSPRPMANPRF
jgi:hypothetical protein